MLALCTSTNSIADVPKMFPRFHDYDFKNWKLDESQPKTDAQKLLICEMQPGKDGDFKKIFGIFNRPLQALAIKQNRIEQFVDLHKNLLHPKGYATLFLIERESDKARFVVYVHRDAGRLRVNVRKFSNDNVWFGEYRSRVVVPAPDTK
jgi:hypothetical protein